MRIIALDIDDCILPTNGNYFGRTDDAEIMLEVNLKRLRMICEKWSMKIFITSSWYSILTLEDGVLGFKYKTREPTYRQFKLIKKYIGEFIIGLSCGNRETDILTLLDAGHKVVALDDIDLSHLENDNYLFCMTQGFINGNHGYKIKNFIEKDMEECSGCGQKHGTVDRNMFDGLCADCTTKALYDYEFAKKAQERNKVLKSKVN